MKLFHTSGTCSLAPHIVAREAGIDIEFAAVDGATKRLADGSDYRAINPKALVPALLLDDGAILTECAAIILYLADRRPEARLAPPRESFERYQLHEWLTFISTELHKNFGLLWRKATPGDTRRMVLDLLAERFAYLGRRLETAPYLMGAFSVADAYAYAVLNWAPYLSIDIGRWPRLAEYSARIAARPKVREALVAEGRH